jgi:crotonobetainyl-CoA:carnitine CoA-transferase CaiB-like acyl-CoA transferase
MSTRRGLLAGIRIIDLSMGWAGPLCGRHLADNGADVIKVESIQHFDWWRGWEATKAFVDDHGQEKAASFVTVNRNKRGITLDLEHPRGKDLLKRLVRTADAVVENYSGGVLPKLGLDYTALRDVKPDLVMMSMPAFGARGPWRSYRAYGSTVEHASGMPHLHGEPDWPPTMLHVAYGDPVAGLNAAAALLVALRHRRRTGEGQFLDLSQSECLFPLAVHGILEQSVTGQAPARTGNRWPHAAPNGSYRCAGEDEWLTLQVQDEGQWLRLRTLVGDALAGFGDLDDRRTRRAELDAAVTAWTCVRTPLEAMQALQAAGVPAALQRPGIHLTRDPQLQARDVWPLMTRAHVGEIPHPRPPYRDRKGGYGIERPAPTLGEHSREVLRELLQLGDAELDELETQQVIGTRPLIGG